MEKIENIRHSLAHVLAAVVTGRYPEVKLGIGPTIENGFYYDFLFPEGVKVGEEDLPDLEEAMRKLIGEKLPFSGEEVDLGEARKIFAGQPFKLELIDKLVSNDEKMMVYKTGEEFVDLCKGGHVNNTKEIKADSFKLTKVAGAYWKGDESNEMLTRIYGVAFESKKKLDEHLEMLEEAERRDHKRLGRELDLFVFSHLVGAGLPLFTPKGTVIHEELATFVQSLRAKRGYERVRIPHIARKELYEASGHWDKFEDELFRIRSRDDHAFAIKPMNCPHHAQLYAARKRSYRELPIRYTEVTAIYRDEQSGELSGLSRVRGPITQDDSHLFCRLSQVEEEVSNVWDLVDDFYAPFGMPLTVRFSRHDPDNFGAYLGTPERWKESEGQLKSLIDKRGVEYIDGIGEAAFYGPKIDFIAKDSIGREWQLATIQLDFNQPERFGLTCVNEKSEEEQIVMMHIAIMGAIERFMSILIEHYAGAFPLWLSPIQVAVLPIGEKHKKYAGEVAESLREEDARVEVHDSDETIGKRIREAETQKIPYILVVGDKEVKSKKVAVRKRGEGDAGEQSLDVLVGKLLREIKQKG